MLEWQASAAASDVAAAAAAAQPLCLSALAGTAPSSRQISLAIPSEQAQRSSALPLMAAAPPPRAQTQRSRLPACTAVQPPLRLCSKQRRSGRVGYVVNAAKPGHITRAGAAAVATKQISVGLERSSLRGTIPHAHELMQHECEAARGGRR